MNGREGGPPWWLVPAAVVTRGAPAAISVLLLGDARALVTPDSQQYLELASSLASSGQFAREGYPEIFRTPLYPALLVPGTWLGAPVAVAIVLQVAISALVAALVFDAAARLTHSRRTAAAAAVIYLLEPGQPLWSSVVLADALLTAIVALLMWLAIRHPPGTAHARRAAMLLAVTAAAGAYAKPPGYALGILFAGGIGAAWWRQAPRRALHAFIAVLLAVNAVGLAAWHARNVRAAGYAGFSTQFERAAFMAAPAALEGARSGAGFAAARDQAGSATGGAGEADRVRAFRRRGVPDLFSSLPAYAWLHARGTVVLLLDPGVYWWARVLGRDVEPTGIGSAYQNAGARAALERLADAGPWPLLIRVLLSLWPAGCLALSAAALWRRRETPAVHVLGVVVVGWALISGGPHADIRLRSPIVPLLSVLAAAALTGAGPRVRRDADARG